MTYQTHKGRVGCFVTCFINSKEVNPGIRTGVTYLMTTGLRCAMLQKRF
jgi:hypothetical protein